MFNFHSLILLYSINLSFLRRMDAAHLQEPVQFLFRLTFRLFTTVFSPNKGLRSKTRAKNCWWSEPWERGRRPTDLGERNPEPLRAKRKQTCYVQLGCFLLFYGLGLKPTSLDPPYNIPSRYVNL